MDIKEYGKSYANFIENDIGKEAEDDLMFFRDEFIKDGKEILVIAIEKCVEYNNFGGSIILKDFINRSKWLLVDTTDDNISKWADNNPMELHARDNKHSLENLTIAMLTKYVYEYLENVDCGRKEG